MNSRNILNIFLIYFLAFTASFSSLEVIKGRKFVDRENYLDYLTYYSSRVENLEFNSYFDYIFNEWLWHKFIFFLKDGFNFSPELIFSFISFFCLLIASLIVYKKTKSIIYVFLLINPIFVDFYYSQLRLAFAFGIWGLAYLISERYKKFSIFFSLIAFCIHTASLFFIVYGFLVYFLCNSRIVFNIKLSIFLLIGFVTSIITGPLRYSILSQFEDRRAEYVDMSFGIVFTSFWVFLLLCIFLDKIIFKKNEIKDYEAYSIIFLSLVLLNYFIGGYSSRFIAATYPFLILSIYNLNSKLKIISLTFYLFYSLILTYYWVN